MIGEGFERKDLDFNLPKPKSSKDLRSISFNSTTKLSSTMYGYTNLENDALKLSKPLGKWKLGANFFTRVPRPLERAKKSPEIICESKTTDLDSRASLESLKLQLAEHIERQLPPKGQKLVRSTSAKSAVVRVPKEPLQISP